MNTHGDSVPLTTRALALIPRTPGSLRQIDAVVPVPAGWVTVRGLGLGVCGTDHQLANGRIGTSPAGSSELIIGHESIGAVVDPGDSDLPYDALVVGVVRMPDPAPCVHCAAGEIELCTAEDKRERGIAGAHGFAARLWALPAEALVRVPDRLGMLGVLVEPASIVAHAWRAIEGAATRSTCRLDGVVVVGAGAIGTLMTLRLAAEGLDVVLIGMEPPDGRAASIVRAVGAAYRQVEPGFDLSRADVLVECSGAEDVAVDLATTASLPRLVCLIGTPEERRLVPIDVCAAVRATVLANRQIIGVVSANKSHYHDAASFLGGSDPGLLATLISRLIPFDQAADAFRTTPNDLKLVIDLT